MKHIGGKFWDFIHSQLEILDAGLSGANLAVHGRPMIAAMQFVKECLVRIGDEEVDDDFLLRDWFGDILAVTTQWYINRYGNELLKAPSEKISGVVAAFGTPLSLQIPLISEFDTAKPAVKRIVFADGILSEEDPLEWIIPAPKLDALNTDAANALRTDAARVSTALRQVYRRILVADLTSTRERDLASSVEGHLEKAAADIQSQRHGAAIWEMHLCVEKILKVFLRQAGASVTKSHDLTHLVADAEEAGLPSCDDLNLHQLPRHGDAIRHRYAELPPPGFEQIMSNYDVVIHVTAHISGALKSGSFAKYNELFIQALPWHPKWKQNPVESRDE